MGSNGVVVSLGFVVYLCWLAEVLIEIQCQTKEDVGRSRWQFWTIAFSDKMFPLVFIYNL